MVPKAFLQPKLNDALFTHGTLRLLIYRGPQCRDQLGGSSASSTSTELFDLQKEHLQQRDSLNFVLWQPARAQVYWSTEYKNKT